MIKKIASAMILLALCIPAIAIDMPNMVGNWTGTAHGLALIKYSSTEPTGMPIYWDRDFTIAITEQNGTRFFGKFISSAQPQNMVAILGVIGSDNKTIALSDETESFWGLMKSPTEMEIFGGAVNLEQMDVGMCTFIKVT